MKIGMMSTWDIQCGIATYTENLVKHLPDLNLTVFAEIVQPSYKSRNENPVTMVRCWDRTSGDFEKLKVEIKDAKIDILHIQFEFGLFHAYGGFIQLVKWLKQQNIKIVMTPHSIVPKGTYAHWFNDVLNDVDMFLCHNKGIYDTLLSWGVRVDRLCIIPHGVVEEERIPQYEAREKLNLPQDKLIVMSLGFITPTKNLTSNIEIMDGLTKRFDNVCYYAYGFPQTIGSNQTNMNYFLQTQVLLNNLNNQNIHLKEGFIPSTDIKYYFNSADIIIMNYSMTPFSCSGGACLILTYGKSAVTTDSPILADLSDCSVRVTMNHKQGLSDALEMLILSEKKRKHYGDLAYAKGRQRSWKMVADMHKDVYKDIIYGDLTQIMDIKEINRDFYNRKYWMEGGYRYCDGSRTEFTGYFGQNWEGGAKIIADGLESAINFKSVIDVGCGMGWLVDELIKRNHITKGMDYSEFAVRNAIGRASGKIDCSDILSYKPTERYDLGIVFDVMEHIYEDELDKTLDKLAEMAKTIIFEIPLAGSPHMPVKPFTIKRGVTPDADLDMMKHMAKGHVNIQERSYWEDKFKQKGWVIREDLKGKFMQYSRIFEYCPNWRPEFVFVVEV